MTEQPQYDPSSQSFEGKKPIDLAVLRDDVEAVEDKKEVVGQAFAGLVDNIMLNRIEQMGSYTAISDIKNNYLVLEDTQRDLHVEVIERVYPEDHELLSTDPSWVESKIISLQVGGQIGELLNYFLYQDGTLRRFDVPAADAEGAAARTGLVDEIMTGGDESLAPALEDGAANLKLQRELGVNSRPVTYKELLGLEGLLDSPDIHPSSTYANFVPPSEFIPAKQ